MRIGVDAYGTRGLRSGLGHYLHNVLKVLLRDHPHHEYVVYCQEDERSAFTFPDLAIAEERVTYRCGGSWHGRALLDVLWHNLVLPWVVRRDRLDVLFVCVDRRVPFAAPVPVVGTVHDLAAFTVDDKYPLSRQIYSRHLVPLLIRCMDRVVTVSAATRRDVIEHLGVDPRRLHLAHNGVDMARFRAIDRSRLAETQARYGIRPPYILYTARLEHPGKNHVGLVRALASIGEGHATAYQLVFAGNPWRNVDQIEAVIDATGMRDRVVFTGFVADDDLPLLYAGAELFVFPSLYEGFGLPLLEAMAVGVPLAVGDVSSLPEVAGPAAEYFDPRDVDSMAAAIRRLAGDADLRRELVAAGHERVRRFTWEASARRTLDAIEAAVR